MENGIHVIAQSEDTRTQPIALYYGISYGHYALKIGRPTKGQYFQGEVI